MEREEKTASKVFGSKGRDSRSGTNCRSMLKSLVLLNGRSASRCRRACEVSMHVKLEIRDESGGELPVGETGSGSGVMSARAMLQLFAPRSRTFGKSRFISFGCR